VPSPEVSGLAVGHVRVLARRYVCKAIPAEAWRIWDRTLKRWWGNFHPEYPAGLLAELNGQKRLDKITALSEGNTPPKR
jgi:hypothetical protein